MKKITAAAKKSAPKFVDDTHVQVTKEFAKNARIFGTAEYKLWKAIKADCPAAEMVMKSIKKNPNKKNDIKNMTYERMAMFSSSDRSVGRAVHSPPEYLNQLRVV